MTIFSGTYSPLADCSLRQSDQANLQIKNNAYAPPRQTSGLLDTQLNERIIQILSLLQSFHVMLRDRNGQRATELISERDEGKDQQASESAIFREGEPGCRLRIDARTGKLMHRYHRQRPGPAYRPR